MKKSSKLFAVLLLLIGLAYILSPLASLAKDRHAEREYTYEDEYDDDDDHEYSAPQAAQVMITPSTQPIVSSLDQTQQQLAEQYVALETRRAQLEQQRIQQQQLAEQLARIEKQLSEQRAALEAKAQQLAQQKAQQEIVAAQLAQEEQNLNGKKQSPVSSAIKNSVRKVTSLFGGSDTQTAVKNSQQNNTTQVKDENRNGISDILEGFLRITRR